MNDNPYESPQARLSEPDAHTPTKVYTPGQVAASALWGGPPATVYLLTVNYKSLGNATLARWSLVLGVLSLVAAFVLLVFLPFDLPAFVLPVAYSMIGHGIANDTQLSKQEINANDDYRRHSHWRVFGIGCLTIVLAILLSVSLLLAFEALGLISLEA